MNSTQSIEAVVKLLCGRGVRTIFSTNGNVQQVLKVTCNQAYFTDPKPSQVTVFD